ncbi:hypothetical protein SLS64_001602 [Diaporthe eres]
MVRIKSLSPSPSGEGVEELEGYDLYTPDTLTLVGSDTTSTNPRKRSNTAYSASPSAKRASTARSRASATSQASATPKKKTSQAKAAPKPKPVQAPKIIFGFDFGTTYSGIAYAFSGDAKKIDILMSWDDTNNDYVKIPSAIKFTRHNDIWGVDAKNLSDALRWFKLTLLNPPDLDVGLRNSVHIQNARAALQDLGMSPVEAISTYMKHMWEHFIEKLKGEEGEETVDTSRFRVVFTIPAIWPNYACSLMEQAVKRAGILKKRTIGRTEHDFVSEPEAAALATLSGIEGRHNIEANDIFVVVDCGGGTADVISYKTIDTDPMTVQEAVKGKGDLCGAIFVDERFKALLTSKLQEVSEDAVTRVSGEEIREMMSRNWEDEIRSQFTGAAKTWTIRLPLSLIDADKLDPNSGWPKFTITSAEVEEVFRPIVEKIYSLVNRQIEAAVKKQGRAPKYVMVVGGFGSSNWSAISRGAVIYGMTKMKLDTSFSVSVRSRISRASFGVVCEEEWDDDLHHAEDKMFDTVLQKDVCIRVMKWHVKQGQDVYVDRHPSFTFTKYLTEPPEKIETTIYMSLAEVPPARKDDTVREVFKLTWDIQIDWDSLEVFVNDQQKSFRKLEYTVEMKSSAGATVFSIYHGGYKQAGRNVALKVYNTADI